MKIISNSLALLICCGLSFFAIAQTDGITELSAPPTRQVTATQTNSSLLQPVTPVVVSVGDSKSIQEEYIITKVAIGNPKIADTAVVSSKEIIVNGLAPGDTSLTVWTNYGKSNYRVIVHKKALESNLQVFNLKNIRLEYNDEGQGTSVIIKQDETMVADLKKILSTFLPAEDFSINTKLNAITVCAPESILNRIDEVLAKIDTPRPQMVIEAKIYEVKDTNDLNRKLSINGQTGTLTGLFDSTSGGVVGWSSNGSAASLLASQMNLLVTEGKASILARPRILAQDGKGSSILVGTKIPIVHADAQGNITVEYVEVGVILAITPRLLDNNYIDTWFRTEVSNVSGYTTSGYPEISSREAQSQARVKIGDTLVVGGLLRTNHTLTRVKFPILGDIPVIGQFFNNNIETKEDSEIIVTLTPKLLIGY